MSTFQREITLPLSIIRSTLEGDDVLSRFDLAKIAVELKEIREKLQGFVQRADRSDSPYGAAMKTKIHDLMTSVDETSDLLNARLESACEDEEDEMAVHMEPPVRAQGESNPWATAEAVTAHTLPLDTSEHDDDTAGRDKIAEAARKVREHEEHLQEEEKKRQTVRAAEERRKREELHQREQVEKEAQRRAAVQVLHERERLITFGAVNHIQGDFDLQAKMRSLNGRACVIDWFADWCGPCRMMAPIFEQFARTYSTVAFFSVDTEAPANRSLVASRGIRALPTFHVFVGDRVIETIQGGNQAKLQAAIHRAVDATQAIVSAEIALLASPPVAAVQKQRPTVVQQPPPAPRPLEPIANDSIITLHVTSLKGKSVGSVQVAAGTTVQDFRRQLRREFVSGMGDKPFLLTMGGLVLDDRRALTSLAQLGARSGSTVRVVPLAIKGIVKLKIVESTTELSLDLSTTRLRALRREARKLTRTTKPRLVFSGRVLDERADDSTLAQLGLSDGCTVLCAGSGAELQEGEDVGTEVETRLLGENMNATLQTDDLYAEVSTEEDQGVRGMNSVSPGGLAFTFKGPLWARAEQLFAEGFGRNIAAQPAPAGLRAVALNNTTSKT